MLGDVLLDAFVRAARHRIDVRIIMPGVPDKKLVFRMSRSFYPVLLEAMKSDFLDTQARCREMKLGENVNISFWHWILDGIPRSFAPLCLAICAFIPDSVYPSPLRAWRTLGSTGLGDPVCTIGLATEEQSCQILLGSFSTMDPKRHVSIGGGKVYLVQNDPLDHFDTDLCTVMQNHNEEEQEALRRETAEVVLLRFPSSITSNFFDLFY